MSNLPLELLDYEILEYAPLTDLYPYISNPQIFQLFIRQVRKRTLEGSLEALETATVNNDEDMMRYVLGIIKTLPEAQYSGSVYSEYWISLLRLALNQQSPTLVRLISETIGDPMFLFEALIFTGDDIPYDMFDMIADYPELLSEYLSLPQSERKISYWNSRNLSVGSRNINFADIIGSIYDKRGLNGVLRIIDYIRGQDVSVPDNEKSSIIWGAIWGILQRNQGIEMNISTLGAVTILSDSASRMEIISLLESPNTTARDILQLGRRRLLASNIDTNIYLNVFEQVLIPENRVEIIQLLERLS